MPRTHYKVTAGGVGPYTTGQIIDAADLGDERNQNRLLNLGAVVEAQPAEIEAYTKTHEWENGNADTARLPDDPETEIIPAPYSSGAPVGYPNPRDDQEGTLAEATKQSEQDALVAPADADAPRKRSR